MENLSTIMEQMTPFLTRMSEVLGQGAEFSWKVAMKQQYVEATIGLFWVALGLVGIIAGLIGVKLLVKNWNEKEVSEAKVGTIAVLIILGVLSFIPFITGSIVAIQHFANPEWYAIKDIMRLVQTSL